LIIFADDHNRFLVNAQETINNVADILLAVTFPRLQVPLFHYWEFSSRDLRHERFPDLGDIVLDPAFVKRHNKRIEAVPARQ